MTPEEIQRHAIDDWGDDLGQAIWVWLDKLLGGKRINWAKRARRRLEDRTIYDQRNAGRSVVAVATHMGVCTRTVIRAYKREMKRRRKAA